MRSCELGRCPRPSSDLTVTGFCPFHGRSNAAAHTCAAMHRLACWRARARLLACLRPWLLSCLCCSALLAQSPAVCPPSHRTAQGCHEGAVGRRGPGKGADARSSTTTLLSCGSRDGWGPHGRRWDGMGWGLPPVGVGTEGGRGRGDCRLAWPPETPVDPPRGHRLPNRPPIRNPSHHRVEASHTTMPWARSNTAVQPELQRVQSGKSRLGARTPCDQAPARLTAHRCCSAPKPKSNTQVLRASTLPTCT